jgi:hypothetical protein
MHSARSDSTPPVGIAMSAAAALQWQCTWRQQHGLAPLKQPTLMHGHPMRPFVPCHVCCCNSALSTLQVVAAANSLIKQGAKNVLVTLAERGSLLVAADGSVTRQAALPVPGGVVVDATAAGGELLEALACRSAA